jgi:hypothetical protein
VLQQQEDSEEGTCIGSAESQLLYPTDTILQHKQFWANSAEVANTSLELSEKEGMMSISIPINIVTAAMEDINERLCWLYTSVKNAIIYCHVGNTYHLSDLTELSEERFHILSS